MKAKGIFSWIGLGLVIVLAALGAERLFGALRYNETVPAENNGALAPTSGYYEKTGGVYERLADGKYGPGIPSAKMVWLHEGGKSVEVVADVAGRYKVRLPALGQYYVTVSHVGFETFTTDGGTAYAVLVEGHSAANFSLRPLAALDN